MEVLKSIGYLIISLIVYYLLQMIGSFIEFGIFGSGAGIEGYELFVPIGMVIIQLILITFLKYKTSLFSNNILYVLTMIIPIGLLIYYYYFQ
ncbi:hypothetical protein [uncultured Algibacter sp.]|uniref:hypothetical protein n=1 Tax=uncultured Algibacter sp. TaxID=298659 RepID=UPI00261E9A09|nr:hypothetical protein [uncultured Algibacter sp.]